MAVKEATGDTGRFAGTEEICYEAYGFRVLGREEGGLKS